jgi:preprotein translocase subunit SecA
MARPADALPDPVIVVIEDEFSALSDEELAEATAEWLAEISAGPTVDLGDIDVAALIREERVDRGE